MKIIVFGAAGEVGSRIVLEALARGHEVKAVVRKTAQLCKLPKGLEPCSGDAANLNDVVRLSQGQDLIISAVRPTAGDESQLALLTQTILKGAEQLGMRVLVVGGAASLKMPDQSNTTVLTAPGFLPNSVIDIARACNEQHKMCDAERRVDWALLSPPAMLVPGERTGIYREGKDELLVDGDGVSMISMEDFAVALIDEAEKPRHSRIRFTVAY